MRIQISFRHINTSIADTVQHPNRQGCLERSEYMPSRHSTHWRGTSQELRECLDNPTRFEEPIKRVKLLTFKQEGISNRRSTNRNIAELKCSRDLMGRFLILATRRHLDLSHVFTFPSTPVPLSLCYCDGTMAKTEKTALFRHLESKVEISFPSSASNDACVVDGSFLLRVLPPNLPATYGRLPLAGSPQQYSFKQRRCQANLSTLSSTHTKCHQSKGWKGNEEVRAIGTTRA